MGLISRRRRSARVILLNDEGQVLLIRFIIPRRSGPFAFWATPGGGIEDGETELEAARREMREELHLEVLLAAPPVHVTTSRFEFDGAMIDSVDTFFAGRCERNAPRLDAPTEAERAAMQEMRWWSVEDIEQAAEPIYPPELATIIRNLARTVSKIGE
jgi:8-oxo-dGTP diphosphatase